MRKVTAALFISLDGVTQDPQLTLLVHPVVAGKGKRLFECGENENGLKRLDLVDHQVSSTGVAMLTYERR